MQNPYLPHTPEQLQEMLTVALGKTGGCVGDLFACVPPELRMAGPYKLNPGMTEPEVRDFFDELGALNAPRLTTLAGAGVYHHFTPSLIPSLQSRSEFLTAYTPYQPEISQGTLQYIFEYQSMMAGLTGLDVSNASMYDGATAAAEAMVMALGSVRKSTTVLVSATVLPAVRRVMHTYAQARGCTLCEIPERDGVTDLEQMQQLLARGGVAAVVLPQPNCYGIVENLEGVAEKVHAAKALLVMHCSPMALGVLRTPGEWGADIACGDAQSLGMPMNYGGPYLGFLCCTKALMRKMPGRIVGATTDAEGQRCFVLTLQAREQHIRRQKATSNICSNQSLMALHCVVYLSLLGAQGLREVNEQGMRGMRLLASMLEEAGVARLTYPHRFFLNEALFTVDFDVDAMLAAAAAKGFTAGVKADADHLLLAVTEMQSPASLSRFVNFLKDFCHERQAI